MYELYPRLALLGNIAHVSNLLMAGTEKLHWAFHVLEYVLFVRTFVRGRYLLDASYAIETYK
jgi:hypothetical protein